MAKRARASPCPLSPASESSGAALQEPGAVNARPPSYGNSAVLQQILRSQEEMAKKQKDMAKNQKKLAKKLAKMGGALAKVVNEQDVMEKHIQDIVGNCF